MFQLYDLEMNEKPYPEGVRPLDIVISSIGKDVLTETMQGAPGVIRYGSRHTTRSIGLKFYLKAETADKFRIMRNELFGFLDEPMYVVENVFPDRRYLVELQEEFTPDRYEDNRTNGELTVTLTTVDLPYAESVEVEEVNGLSIYVEGNQRIEPYRQELKIKIRNVESSTEFLELRNTRNNSYFRIPEAVGPSLRIDVDGVMVTINSAQALRRTEKEFITLEPGTNTLELTGATSADVTTIFRNYYK